MTRDNTVPLLSIIVLTYNEEQNIRTCLESVKDLSDQIFIVDSYSTDKTIEIAREYTRNIYQNPFIDQARQFNWALDNLPLMTEWIMRLDADERVTPDLHNELLKQLQNTHESITGFYIKRRVYFMGRWIKHGGYYPTWLLRLFRRDQARCEQKNMDEHIVILNGKTDKLIHDIIDENHKGLSFWIEKHNKFAEREMMEIACLEDRIEGETIMPKLMGDPVQRKRWFKNNLYLKLPLLFRSLLYFLYRYFIKFGFLDGKEGLIFHFLQGFWYRFLVDAKIYEAVKMRQKTEENEAISSYSPNRELRNKPAFSRNMANINKAQNIRIAIVNITSGGMSIGYKKILNNIIPRISEHPSVSEVYVAMPANISSNGLKQSDDNIHWAEFSWNWVPESISDNNILMANRKFSRSIKAFSPDVIFVPTARVARIHGIPTVTMLQNMEPLAYDGANPFSEKIVNWARAREARQSIIRSDRVIAISDFVKDHMVNEFSVPHEKIGLVYLGADSLNNGSYMKPAAIPEAWTGKFLFTAGSIRPARGLEDLLNILHRLKMSEIPGLVIAGEPSPRMHAYHEKLKSWIQKHGLSDRVCWAGHLNYGEMCWCYQHCRAFVMTSRVEACPNIALEVLSNGCICISNDNPPMPEIIGDSSFYYSVKDSDSLIKAVYSVVNLNDAERRDMRERSKNRALNFSWDVCVEKIVSELKKAVELG